MYILDMYFNKISFIFLLIYLVFNIWINNFKMYYFIIYYFLKRICLKMEDYIKLFIFEDILFSFIF